MSIHIITDSASDARPSARGDLTVLPMLVSFREEQFEDGVTLSHDEFYRRLDPQKPLPTTSQVTPFRFYEALEPHRAQGEEVLILTMSGKLSGTYQSALAAAGGDPKVFVFDTGHVTIGERIFVAYALHRARQGAQGAAILRELEELRPRVHLVAVMDTLEYLKKGGRISKTAAVAGGLLGIKPVVETIDGVIQVVDKARGMKQGRKIMVQRIWDKGGVDLRMPWFLGYTGLTDETLRPFVEEGAELWAESPRDPVVTSVGAAIGTHVGPGAIALAWVEPKQ